MNKKLSQVELCRAIAQQTALPQNYVEAFISQLFKEIEKEIITDSFIKVNGLGLFRVIQSGDTKRILFLGSKKSVEESLDIEQFSKELSDDVPPVVSDTRFAEPFEFTNNQVEETEIVASRNESFDNQAEYLHGYRKNNLLKTCIISLIVLVVLITSYLVMDFSESKDEEKPVVNFIELENTDPLSYSSIVIPESDVSLQFISETYFGDEVFWPYIYLANEDLIRNILIIQAGSIIKIPIFNVNLAELKNGTAASVAKKLGDEIKKSKMQ